MLRLTDKELLVLAVGLGADSFYAIKDPFRGMSQREIWAEIPAIQLALEKKGYAVLGFEDSFEIRSFVKDLLEVCVHCEKYLIFDSIISGNAQAKRLLYLHDGKSVALNQNDAVWEVHSVTPTEFVADLQGIFSAAEVESPEPEAMRLLEQSVLEQAAKQLDNSQVIEILQTAGCSLPMAEALLAGLRKSCTYCSMQMVDLTARSMQALNCLLTQKGNLQIEPAETDDITKWQISWADNERLKDWFAETMRHFAGGEA